MEPEPKVEIKSIPKADRLLWLTSLVLIGYLCWPSFRGLNERWGSDPRYSHGYLVPIFSAFLLWYRRDLLHVDLFRPSWWGLIPVFVGSVLKVVGGAYFLTWFDDVSLVFILFGLVLLFGGWPMLRWAWPSVAFLFFMIPLPARAEYALGYPLQVLATRGSTFALETFGLPAVAEGFVITMDEVRIGVVEACNGLGMLVMFFAYATAAVFLIKRPVIDKVVIMISAIPIALLANIARITLTGLLHTLVGGDVADHFYHDLAGWLMMPMALLAFWFELTLLDWLFIEVEAAPKEPSFALAGGIPVKPKGMSGPKKK